MKRYAALLLVIPVVAFGLTYGCAWNDSDDLPIPTVQTAPDDGISINTLPSMGMGGATIPPPNNQLKWVGGAATYIVEIYDTAQTSRPRWSTASSSSTTVEMDDLRLYTDDTNTSTINEYIQANAPVTISWRVLGSNGQNSGSRTITYTTF